jgi:hypothetical protein
MGDSKALLLLINHSNRLRLNWEDQVSETLGLDKSLLILDEKFNKNDGGWLIREEWVLRTQQAPFCLSLRDGNR